VLLRCAAVVCAGALLLAGCGSSGGAASSSSSKSKTSTVTVGTRAVSGVGTVLVDNHGRTLYTFTKGGNPVQCTGPCASAWPPFRIAAGSTPKGPAGVKGLGVTTAGQVTDRSLPLYRYVGDSSAGQATGNGINSFGGVWRVVMVGGSTNATSSTTTSSTPSGY